MNNDITINPEEILALPDGSITDGETIRQIALYGIKHNDSSLDCKIKREFQLNGLYPHIMMSLDTEQGMAAGVLYGESSVKRNNHILLGVGQGIHPEHHMLTGGSQGIQPTLGDTYYKRKPFSGGLHRTIKCETDVEDIIDNKIIKTRAIGMTEVTGVNPPMKDIVKPAINDIVKQLLMQTPLETRFKVSIEMTFMQMLVELGFISDRPWDDESEEDNRILKIILDTAEKESKYLVKQVKKWQADGMPEQK